MIIIVGPYLALIILRLQCRQSKILSTRISSSGNCHRRRQHPWYHLSYRNLTVHQNLMYVDDILIISMYPIDILKSMEGDTVKYKNGKIEPPECTWEQNYRRRK